MIALQKLTCLWFCVFVTAAFDCHTGPEEFLGEQVPSVQEDNYLHICSMERSPSRTSCIFTEGWTLVDLIKLSSLCPLTLGCLDHWGTFLEELSSWTPKIDFFKHWKAFGFLSHISSLDQISKQVSVSEHLKHWWIFLKYHFFFFLFIFAHWPLVDIMFTQVYHNFISNQTNLKENATVFPYSNMFFPQLRRVDMHLSRLSPCT